MAVIISSSYLSVAPLHLLDHFAQLMLFIYKYDHVDDDDVVVCDCSFYMPLITISSGKVLLLIRFNICIGILLNLYKTMTA